jgi:hypothetical protein
MSASISWGQGVAGRLLIRPMIWVAASAAVRRSTMAAPPLRRDDPSATGATDDRAQLPDRWDLLGSVDQGDQRGSRLIEGERSEMSFVAGS